MVHIPPSPYPNWLSKRRSALGWGGGGGGLWQVACHAGFETLSSSLSFDVLDIIFTPAAVVPACLLELLPEVVVDTITTDPL